MHSSRYLIMIPQCLRTLATLICFSCPLAAVDLAEISSRIDSLPDHPRLFFPRSAEAALKLRIEREPLIAAVHRSILSHAEALLQTKPSSRVLTGKRLLGVSRSVVERVMFGAYAWRMTGEDRFLNRTKDELLAVAAFDDWNPSHFLDVAEASAAMAIGYDWLYQGLDRESRATISKAIIDKALTPAHTIHGWSRITDNWNQVCNGGIALGALAVGNDGGTLSTESIHRAITTIPLAMGQYAPDGAYPESASYWGYGTTYNVLLIAALETAMGSDFGLSKQAGFLASADYMLHTTGPSNRCFNYSDCFPSAEFQPAFFWFANRRNDPYLLWNALNDLSDKIAIAGNKPPPLTHRFLPLLLAWTQPLPDPPVQPTACSWSGGGPNPVGLHRSGWTRDATFIGMKGGSPSVNHGHMDVGTFVMDADGLRWAEDLGMQDYHSLESKKVDLWNRRQDSQRWQVFRIGPFSHNILTVDGQLQRVDGSAPIVHSRVGRTVFDTSSLYRGQLEKAWRGISLMSDRSVLVQDEITAPDHPVTVRWAMVTKAAVAVDGPGVATLSQQGKRLTFRVIEPTGMQVRIWPTDPPPRDFDARNEGSLLIGFEVVLPARSSQRLVVHLTPGTETSGTPEISPTPMADW